MFVLAQLALVSAIQAGMVDLNKVQQDTTYYDKLSYPGSYNPSSAAGNLHHYLHYYTI